MTFQIGDRVRTRAGALGTVRSVEDPLQIHVTLGEGMAESVQAFGPEELTGLDASPAPALSDTEPDTESEAP